MMPGKKYEKRRRRNNTSNKKIVKLFEVHLQVKFAVLTMAGRRFKQPLHTLFYLLLRKCFIYILRSKNLSNSKKGQNLLDR